MMTARPRPSADESLVRRVNTAIDEEARRLGAAVETLDMYFLVFLREVSQFGYFTYGPVAIDVRLIEEIVWRTTPRGSSDENPAWADDLVRFSRLLVDEVRRSGAARIDELHFLLAFMRAGEGLPSRVFAELGVTPAQVERHAREARSQSAPLEKLFSPEEAADYLGIHVQTVRSWIRSGRLRARRLAGQRALRISASDLESVLEPVEQSDPSMEDAP